MPKIASVAIDVKLNLDPAKRQVTEFGHSGGRIAGGHFELSVDLQSICVVRLLASTLLRQASLQA
ncbi:MAG: hypothetical protein CLLPBCKN_001352 [Chroococcidiopsis cubana SAG 39.79]|uniref:Uncharacterized protein n=1 Tax=Chroococcidiopsis cubana SAG 39.79 TaxID=388085 RepID=A0AB37UCY5_9CYAN|nr:hypothetical protein [Chroococcidiopsis cubana SAG 39.79]PSB64933.1 hypothetical protein C7B79_07600 [Chroococcidiopsis cubana CCALA 043]RUT05372.1 hypothetical protein DSM107010_55250 [Chroococcidiopsis cubana SAG 39.79]